MASQVLTKTSQHGIPRNELVVLNTDKAREKEQQKIQEYRDLVDQVSKKMHDNEHTVGTQHLISTILKLNPEYYTIWNYRRVLLQHEIQTIPSSEKTEQSIADLLSNDLRFLIPLLKEFPKCYWIWNHRLWLLQQTNSYLEKKAARRFWYEEFGLVGKMLSLDSRNFHGWGYRRKVVAQLESPALNISENSGTQDTRMTQDEFDYTTRMIQTNLSNFSAWHNRSKLIPRLLDERGASLEERRKMLDDELQLIRRALWTDPYDQSLWFYHQSLMASVDPSLIKFSMVPGLDNDQRCRYVSKELEDILEMLDGAEDCKWIYQALIQYTLILVRLGKKMEEVERIRMTEWLSELRELDPLRRGRWDDLAGLIDKA
ncbi:MAG: Rab geranylgeranyltransferase [Cirrosporium novae-zelandiae]|nr:MAG: Rab geranylgeranyltransferase [Cirrosporium novae-zelandiae]